MVHLHGKLAAGLDVQQLDLEARPDIERLEVAPGPIVAEVLLLLLAVRLLQAFDDRRNFLRAVLVGNEQRIGRIDDDEVLDADRRDERPLGVDVAVGGVLQHGVASDEVALVVARRDLPQRRPRADVAPADVDRQHGRGVRPLHHGVVDRDVGRRREFGFAEAQKAQVFRGIREAPGARLPGFLARGAPALRGTSWRRARRCRCSRNTCRPRDRLRRWRGRAFR